MILSSYRARVLQNLRETSSNGAFTTTELNNWINDGVSKVFNAHQWLAKKRYKEVSNFHSEIEEIDGAVITFESTAGLQAGMWLYLYSAAGCETVQIVSVDSGGEDIVVDRTPADRDYTEAASANIYLPHNCQKILTIRCKSEDESVLMNAHMERDFWVAVNSPEAQGIPSDFYYGEIDRTIEDGLTLDASSNTTTAICSNFSGSEDDYYKEWMFINETRANVSRVKSYTAATKTIILESAITGQVAADVVYLEKRKRNIYIYPIPDDVYTFWMEYLTKSVVLVNEWDEPDFGEYQDMLDDAVVAYASAQAFAADLQQQQAVTYNQMFADFLTGTKANETVPKDRLLSMKTPKQMRRLRGFAL